MHNIFLPLFYSFSVPTFLSLKSASEILETGKDKTKIGQLGHIAFCPEPKRTTSWVPNKVFQ